VSWSHCDSRVATTLVVLLTAASVGLMGFLMRSAAALRHQPAASAESGPFAYEVRPAVFVDDNAAPDPEGAWAKLSAAIELVQSADQMLIEAQSLQAMAAALVEQARTEEGDDEVEDDGDAYAREVREVIRSRGELAEIELALAGKVLGAAQRHAERARATFNMAWANVVRAARSGRRPEPGAYTCKSDARPEFLSQLATSRLRM